MVFNVGVGVGVGQIGCICGDSGCGGGGGMSGCIQVKSKVVCLDHTRKLDITKTKSCCEMKKKC